MFNEPPFMTIWSFGPEDELDKSKFNVGDVSDRLLSRVSVPTLSVPAPGERIPPLLTETGPVIVPVPPSVAPEKTVRRDGIFEPFSRSVPARTALVPVMVLLPPSTWVPVPTLSKQMALPALLILLIIVPEKLPFWLLPPMT